MEGARALLSDSKRGPRIVLLELYEPNMSSFSTTVNEIVGKMKDFGYGAFVAMQGGEVRPFQEADTIAFIMSCLREILS
jgi:hypothetical protein